MTTGTTWQQLRYLLYRNLLLKRRKVKEAVQEILAPIYYLVILVILTIFIPNTTFDAVTYSPPMAVPLNAPPFMVPQPLILGFVPSTSAAVAAVMDRIVNGSSVLPSFRGALLVGFASDDEAVSYYLDNPGGLFAVVEFNANDDGTLPPAVQLTIRINGSYAVSTNSISQSAAACRQGVATCSIGQYISSGFIDLQTAVIQAIALETTGTNINVTGSTQGYPMPVYTTTSAVLLNLTAIYMVIAFAPLVQFLLVNIVLEKEKKIKEGMAMMGLRDLPYFLSWFIVYGALMLITTVAMAILCVIFIFPGANFGIIWLMLMFYGLSLIAYSFALTPFFDKPKVAGVVGSLVTLVLSVIYVPLAGTSVQASSAAKWACSLLSPVALALGMSESVAKQAAGIPINAETIRVGTQSEGFSIASCIIMLAVDIILYFFLAWYLDNVIPTEYGIKRPWYFIFQPSTWLGNANHIQQATVPLSSISDTDNDNVETVPPEIAQHLAVDIRNVRKIFPKPDLLKGSKEKVALDGVNLQMYEGQIFGLLGHNGAGKSTLVSILSGLFAATSGSITVLGKDLATEMQDLRSMMGVCPQQNILFDELTAREHLVVFAGFKGVSSNAINAEVERVLHNTDLADSADKQSKTLSGGQKRKLCVGMALIGDPKIIFLDEPTAGMDPFSRRKLWDLLQNTKPGRVVMITSHFLDEIDILADRKAILSHGKVRCCGTSLFLKNRFGLGYYIAVDRKDDAAADFDAQKVLCTIQRHVPGAEIDRFLGAELAFRLPLANAHAFPALFDELDTSLDRLCLSSYAISMTSLEEVFLRLENDADSGESTEESKRKSTAHSKRLSPVDITESNSKVQLRYLTFAKMRQIVRSPRTYFFFVILPVVFIIVGLVIYKTVPMANNNFANLALSPTMYDTSLTNPVPVANNTASPLDTFLASLSFPAAVVSPAGFYADLINSTSSVALRVNSSGPNALRYDVLVNSTDTHTLPIYWGTVLSDLYASSGPVGSGISVTTTSHPLPYTGPTFDVTSYVGILMIGTALTIAPGGFAVEVVKDRERKIRHQLNVMGLKPWVYWASCFFRDMSLFAIPGVLVMILIPAFQLHAFLGPAMLPVVLTLLIYMPSMILFSYNLSFLFSKHETCMSVLPPLANLFAIIPYYAVAAVDQSGYREEAEIMHYCILAVDPTYGIMGAFHYISMVQMVATLTGQPVTMASYFAFSANVSGTLLIMLGHFIISAASLLLIERVKVDQNRPSATADIDEHSPLLDPESQGPDSLNFKEDEDVQAERTRCNDGAGAASMPLTEYDRTHMIAVHNLSKSFTVPKVNTEGGNGSYFNLCRTETATEKKKVVNDVCLGVRPGECFGLLGPNGAGKTTTLSMITGELKPTHGHCVVAQKDTRTSLREAFDKMGYCPQFDALFDDLTVREHLIVFGAIKGIPTEIIQDRADDFMDVLAITEFADKVAKDLSGGTRRKLSFCVAMIGSPKVAVLDEPSTGMDPSSRRFMWDIILENVKDRAAILTTHSMEEADALCSRIAIMVKGRLRCLGTSGHLKSKYGDGFTLEMKVPTTRVSEIKQFMEATFSHQHHLSEEYAGRLIYKIPSRSVSVGQVFKALEGQKQIGLIEEYSFSQTTLEQVFIEFAKQQESD